MSLLSFILTFCLSAVLQKNDKIVFGKQQQPATTKERKVRLAEFCVEESNNSRCGFSVESFLTSSQQTATTSSYFLFNRDFFHCHSLMDSVVIFIEMSLIFCSKTRIRSLWKQILHIKCQRVLERTTEKRTLRYYWEKSIKSGVQGTLNTNQRQILFLLPHIRTVGCRHAAF